MTASRTRRLSPMALMLALVLEDDRPWGDAATRVQRDDARAFFDTSPNAPRYHFNTRARGYSKTADAAAYWITDALTGPTGAKSYWLAADAEQGGLALDSIRGYLDRTPLLEGKLDVQTRKVVTPETGAELIVLAADAPSAWGLRPRNVFVDEFAQWGEGESTRALWLAMRTALAKNPLGRLAVLTTAGRPDHPAFKELQHARTDPRWRTSETPGPAPWMSRDALDEQRAALPESVYRQLFENEWTALEGSFLEPQDVEAAFTHAGPALRPEPGRWAYVAGLDLGTVNDSTVLSIGHAEGRTWHLDLQRRWTGTRANPVSLEQVAASVEQVNERFRLRRLLVDPWQATLMIERLERFHGVRCAEPHTFTTASKGNLAVTLLQAVRAGAVALYPAEQLREELLGLRLVPLAGGAGFGFDHVRSGHDDTVVSLALAMVASQAVPSGTGWSYSAMPDDYPGNEYSVRRGDLTLTGAHHRDKR